MAALISAAILGSFNSSPPPAPTSACGAGYYSTGDGRCCPSDHPYYYNGRCNNLPENSQTSSQGSTNSGSGGRIYYVHAPAFTDVMGHYWESEKLDGLTLDECQIGYGSATCLGCPNIDSNCKFNVQGSDCPSWSIGQKPGTAPIVYSMPPPPLIIKN